MRLTVGQERQSEHGNQQERREPERACERQGRSGKEKDWKVEEVSISKTRLEHAQKCVLYVWLERWKYLGFT